MASVVNIVATVAAKSVASPGGDLGVVVFSKSAS